MPIHDIWCILCAMLIRGIYFAWVLVSIGLTWPASAQGPKKHVPEPRQEPPMYQGTKVVQVFADQFIRVSLWTKRSSDSIRLRVLIVPLVGGDPPHSDSQRLGTKDYFDRLQECDLGVRLFDRDMFLLADVSTPLTAEVDSNGVIREFSGFSLSKMTQDEYLSFNEALSFRRYARWSFTSRCPGR
jgi:hypothetical protein